MVAMTFNIGDIFLQVSEEFLFSYMGLDYKFLCEVPESSLNSTERVNTIIGITGEIEGNIMFCYSFDTAKYIAIPAHRYAEISPEVKALCEKYDLPYNSGPLHKQFFSVVKKICRLALPDSG